MNMLRVWGGGIYCYQSSPTIFGNIVTGNNGPTNAAVLGYGSGIVVRDKVVLTAAHVLFDERTTNFVPAVAWYHERHAGEYDPQPIYARGWYVFPLRPRDKEPLTAHGFKGMASTRLNEMGCWNPDAIERQLAHQESSDVRRAYMHAAEYWPERVKMMQAWADYLDELRETGKVIQLRSVSFPASQIKKAPTGKLRPSRLRHPRPGAKGSY